MNLIISRFIFLICIALILLIIKSNNTVKKRKIIIDAIYAFNIDMIQKGDYEGCRSVFYDDMESYEETLFRIQDWGYTRILPKEKFELIKPYIN